MNKDKRAQQLLKKHIIPAIEAAISDLSAEIFAEVVKQHPNTHAPEIHIGAHSAATQVIHEALLEYLKQNKR